MHNISQIPSPVIIEPPLTLKKVFDIALAATLKDNDIEGLYTANVSDFKDFSFLKVVNPLVAK